MVAEHQGMLGHEVEGVAAGEGLEQWTMLEDLSVEVVVDGICRLTGMVHGVWGLAIRYRGSGLDTTEYIN